MIAEKTLKLRHFIVQLIAPKVHQTIRNLRRGNNVPRPMIKFLKQKFDDERLVGVEIGVAEGINAESILLNLNMKKLFLIDPYQTYTENTLQCIRQEKKYIDCFAKAKHRLNSFKKQIIFIQKTSEEAVDILPDSLDFVYIDGNHSYDSVKVDIQNYYPKVREGGVLGGHDFTPRVFGGVVKAVLEFTYQKHLFLHQELADWWIFKPRERKHKK